MEIVSSDTIREKYNINSYDDESNKRTFKILNKYVRKLLSAGQSCVYDATNVNSNKRLKFLNSLSQIDCEKICVLQIKDVEGCVLDNISRGLTVPNDVIYRMYANFNFPRCDEKWDKYILHVIEQDEKQDVSNPYLRYDIKLIKDIISKYCEINSGIDEQILKVAFLNCGISKKHTEKSNHYSDAYDFVVNHSHLIEQYASIILMVAQLIGYYPFFSTLEGEKKESFQKRCDKELYKYLEAMNNIESNIKNAKEDEHGK